MSCPVDSFELSIVFFLLLACIIWSNLNIKWNDRDRNILLLCFFPWSFISKSLLCFFSARFFFHWLRIAHMQRKMSWARTQPLRRHSQRKIFFHSWSLCCCHLSVLFSFKWCYFINESFCARSIIMDWSGIVCHLPFIFIWFVNALRFTCYLVRPETYRQQQQQHLMMMIISRFIIYAIWLRADWRECARK